MDRELFWKETFKVRAYEAGPDQRATIHSICNYLQESAANHAVAMKVAMDTLLKANMTWVLSRLHIRMEKFPYWNQVMTIETWPATKEAHHAVRDFRLMVGDELVGVATSSWMMIDFVKRRPVPIPDFMDRYQNREAGRTLHDPFDPLPEIPDRDGLKGLRFRVRMSDLDMNQHVNAVHYLAWALESVPADIWKSAVAHEVEINYRSECHYGDAVLSYSRVHEESADRLVILHQLIREKDGREVTRIRSTWRKK